MRSRETFYGGPPDSNAALNASSSRWRLIAHLANAVSDTRKMPERPLIVA
jgi:hypothetical protein